MAFLHGVETITIKSGTRVLEAVESAIVTLVGIAPSGPSNEPTLVTSLDEARQFGPAIPGFNIPLALDTIFAHGSANVVVINTFEADNNTTEVTDELLTVTNGRFKLANAPIGNVVIKNSAGSVTFVKGTDYTIDEFGNGVAISASVVSGAKATYDKLDTTTINASFIVGTIGIDGSRTGFKAVDLIPTVFGFNPKVIISPGYSHLPTVSAEMLSLAEKHRAIALLDAPDNTTVSGAISGRGPSGTFGWNISNPKAVLLYPNWDKADPDPRALDGSVVTEYYSSVMAGVIAANDRENGYWYSPSNKQIKGVLRPKVMITCSLTDPSAQNQLLNAAGIVTYFTGFGTGVVTFGNRSSLYPSDTDVVNFIPVQRVKDILDQSVERAQLPFLDLPVTSGTIDAIRMSVKAFINTLIGRGAIIDGDCIFDTTLNTPETIKAGQLIFTIDFAPPTPAERITFNSYVNVSRYNALLTT